MLSVLCSLIIKEPSLQTGSCIRNGFNHLLKNSYPFKLPYLVNGIAIGLKHRLHTNRQMTGLYLATLRSLIGFIEVLSSLKQEVVLINMLPSISPITVSHQSLWSLTLSPVAITVNHNVQVPFKYT